MIETILSMWLPLSVLLVAGTVTIAVAWWATIAAEDKDGWWYSGPPKASSAYPYLIACPRCNFILSRASHPGLYEITCHSQCGFQGTVTVQ